MRGLLMIEPLYHQTVAGNKTQTRRSGGLDVVNDTPLQLNGHQRSPDDWEMSFSNNIATFGNKITRKLVTCKPRYKVGEVLYLKEPFFKNQDGIILFKYPSAPSIFKKLGFYRKWSNKLFMPASAARAFVRITGIKCERLLDISDADCIAEGIERGPIKGNSDMNVLYKNYLGNGDYFVTPKESFLSLYKFANKVKDVPNLWVFVYEFEYITDYKI